MKSDELHQWYRHHGPVGPDAPEPILAASGEGAWLVDDAGRMLLDFASGGGATLGYQHPDIARVLKQAGHLPATEAAEARTEVELMHKLAELVPGGMNRRVLVCESGREALAKAIELARKATGRQRVSYLSDLTDQSDRTLGVSRDVAAVVAHPLDGRIRQARQACDAAGALLIDDETGIGPGATGRMFAIELASGFSPQRHEDTKSQSRPDTSAGEVRPDIYVLGRGWAGGLPFGACVTRSSSLRWEHGSSGNPQGCAAALEVIRLLEAGLLEQGRKLAAYLEKRFCLLSCAKLEPELWGAGLVRTLAFRKGKGAATGFVTQCRELGLLLHYLSADSMAVRPPLVATEKDVDFAAGVLEMIFDRFDGKL
jgi:acetylornithine/N-succinyldiaminopimelate aminotransferase